MVCIPAPAAKHAPTDRLSENATELNQAQVIADGAAEDAQKVRDAESLISSLMGKCVALKKDKEVLKKKVRRLESKENKENGQA